ILQVLLHGLVHSLDSNCLLRFTHIEWVKNVNLIAGGGVENMDAIPTEPSHDNSQFVKIAHILCAIQFRCQFLQGSFLLLHNLLLYPGLQEGLDAGVGLQLFVGGLSPSSVGFLVAYPQFVGIFDDIEDVIPRFYFAIGESMVLTVNTSILPA